MTDQGLPTNLDELIGVLRSLPRLSPIERAKMVRALDNASRGILGHVGDQAVFEAAHEIVGTRKRSHAEVASALGVSASRVNEAIQRYRRRAAADGSGDGE